MQGKIFGNFTLLAVLVIPAVIALGAWISLVLGRDGEPGATHRREGSITRALRQDESDKT